MKYFCLHLIHPNCGIDAVQTLYGFCEEEKTRGLIYQDS